MRARVDNTRQTGGVHARCIVSHAVDVLSVWEKFELEQIVIVEL